MSRQELMAALKRQAGQIDAAMRNDLQVVGDPLLREILNYVLFSGGKRLRPILAVLAGRLCGRRDRDLERLALAFEYLHVATLLHDDIIDGSASRRGRPVVNLAWGPTHAILAGDFLHTRSMFLVGSLGGPPCLEIYFRATSAMVEGEFLQMRNAENFNLSEEDYFQAVTGKTARLIGAVCETGALFAGAAPGQRQALSGYGMALGSAFQIIDDLLDYQGDQAKTGKTKGNDFLEGKMTLPLIHTLSRAKTPERDYLLGLLQGPRHERQASFEPARALIETHDGFGYARQRAEQLIASGLAALEIFDSPKHAEDTALLAGLAGYVLSREK